jgi:hypothetical protein
MLQKIQYVYLNPVRRGWVASPEHGRSSSADVVLPGALPRSVVLGKRSFGCALAFPKRWR